MWPAILVVIGFFLLFIMFLYVFLGDLVIITVNGIILYLILLRAFVELRKGKYAEYFVGALVSLTFLSFWGNFFPVWKVTTFVFQMFLIAHIIQFFKRSQSSKSRKHKRR